MASLVRFCGVGKRGSRDWGHGKLSSLDAPSCDVLQVKKEGLGIVAMVKLASTPQDVVQISVESSFGCPTRIH
jgi:hypothetical protein